MIIFFASAIYKNRDIPPSNEKKEDNAYKRNLGDERMVTFPSQILVNMG